MFYIFDVDESKWVSGYFLTKEEALAKLNEWYPAGAPRHKIYLIYQYVEKWGG